MKKIIKIEENEVVTIEGNQIVITKEPQEKNMVIENSLKIDAISISFGKVTDEIKPNKNTTTENSDVDKRFDSIVIK